MGSILTPKNMHKRITKTIIGGLVLTLLLAGCNTNTLPAAERALQKESANIQKEVSKLVDAVKGSDKFASLHNLSDEAIITAKNAQASIKDLQFTEVSTQIAALVETEIEKIQQLAEKINEISNNSRKFDELTEEELENVRNEYEQAQKNLNGYISRLEQSIQQLETLNQQLVEAN